MTYHTVKTADSSITLWSDDFEEHCHSLCGARAETNHNYILATNLLAKAQKQKSLAILEVGFGTGLGYHQTAYALEQNQIRCQLEFISLELNEAFIKWSIGRPYDELTYYPQIRSLEKNENNYRCANQNGNLTILVGNAIETISQIDTKIDLIFQDPFSPKKNPTLWTREWFESLYLRSAPDCVMTTYSAAGKVSRAMTDAKWTVEKFPGFSQKKEAIRATKII